MRRFFKKTTIIVTLLTLIGGFLHFYNINWGSPFYFHPDERNIASAVSQLQFPKHMNPQFFAYGSLPIYIIYFTGYATNYILSLLVPGPQSLNPNFAQAILVSRIYSAIFATLLIPILYVIAKKLSLRDHATAKQSHVETAGLLAAFFTTACTGFIQFAHFGTFEMWLTFFSALLFWSCLNALKEKKLEHIILLSLIFGILVSVKVSSLALLPIPIAVIFFQQKLGVDSGQARMTSFWGRTKRGLQNLPLLLSNCILFILITAFIYLITNPYTFLDTKDFTSSMQYESSVALGTEQVFYTGNFVNTIPGIYQLLHVYPFLINPLMTIIFIPSFLYICFIAIKQRNPTYYLLATIYLLVFISNAFLYVKWTRYMIPTLPFIMLSVALALSALKQNNKQLGGLLMGELMLLIFLNFLAAFSYFKVAFIDVDSRVLAAIFAQQTIPLNAQILSEPADLGALPFQEAFPHFDTFNFYDLDSNPLNATETELQQKVANAQYIILPSQRIIQSRLANPSKFPKGYVFYKTLLNGNLGFKKIYETPCDVFCTIVYLGDPVYWWEQTASVFDHPTVMIFKKTNQ